MMMESVFPPSVKVEVPDIISIHGLIRWKRVLGGVASGGEEKQMTQNRPDTADGTEISLAHVAAPSK